MPLGGISVEDLGRGITLLEAELARPAGSVIGQALERVVEAFPLPKDLASPQAFVNQAVEALEDFPALIIEELANPKIGIVRELRFFPRIADLVKWCEARIARYQYACNDARKELEHREREVTIRRLQEEAAAAAREEQAREEAAKVLEPEILARLKALPIGTTERPRRVGEERAAHDWQKAMARSLSRRPDLAERYLGLVAGDAELRVWTTERENRYRGSGWPDLSHRLGAMFTKGDSD